MDPDIRPSNTACGALQERVPLVLRYAAVDYVASSSENGPPRRPRHNVDVGRDSAPAHQAAPARRHTPHFHTGRL
ncbi:hypothetical protein EVAR_38293_1 [Eumeta japonica]|uniref:Uncharacterized protein n=1 Tax=Eumeta variegata TaxID=151549 RepID=A0A4C1W7Y1_EUMVA|nr:hypothetical protein EVAR_38293_1 [Eumeta japonica]